jgi:two-component system phosphate regulon sensor histidine kinase PhoR
MDLVWILGLALIVLLLFALVRTRRALAKHEMDLAIAHRERERERAKTAEWVDTLANTTSLGLLVLNAQGRIMFINRAASALLEIQEGVGKSVREVAWGSDLQSSVDYSLKEKNEPVDQTIVRGDRTFAARLRAVRLNGEAAVLVELAEVTELQRLGRARRDFVANISHELRTPLTSLQLLMETINAERLTDRNLAVDFLGKMRLQIDLLRQLSNELMDLALIESGQAPIKLVETDAADLANQVVETLRPQAERQGLALKVDVPDHLMVLADAQAVQKVLGNLIHNAIKFTPSGGRIEVRAAPRGDNVEFAVEDTGVGIPAKDLPRIFERFYKVDRSRTRTNGELHGTGLGLAIAKHVIGAHGGSLWATSVEGHGSTFYFTLPQAC